MCICACVYCALSGCVQGWMRGCGGRVCVNVCMCACVHVCMCCTCVACVHVCMCACVHMYVHVHVCMCACALYAYAHVCMCRFVHASRAAILFFDCLFCVFCVSTHVVFFSCVCLSMSSCLSTSSHCGICDAYILFISSLTV